MIPFFKLVRLVDGSRFRPYNSRSEQGSKTNMRQIAGLDFFQTFLVRVCQIQITSEYCNIDSRFGKHIFQITGKARCQRAVGHRIFGNHFGKRQMSAGKTLPRRNLQPLRKRRLFDVM